MFRLIYFVLFVWLSCNENIFGIWSHKLKDQLKLYPTKCSNYNIYETIRYLKLFCILGTKIGLVHLTQTNYYR